MLSETQSVLCNRTARSQLSQEDHCFLEVDICILEWLQKGPGAYTSLGMCIDGSHGFTGRVDVGGTVTAKDIIIATGSVPFVPPGIPIDGKTVRSRVALRVCRLH